MIDPVRKLWIVSGFSEEPDGACLSCVDHMRCNPRSVETRISACGPHFLGGSATPGIGAGSFVCSYCSMFTKLQNVLDQLKTKFD